MNQFNKDIFEKRKSECENMLFALVSSSSFDVDEHLSARMPANTGGVYLIARRGEMGQYLWAGKSKDLRRRVCNDHRLGGGDRARSDLIQIVIDRGMVSTRTDAQSWIRTNCTVQWLVVADPALRGWAEHYVLSITQPIWCPCR
jgi:hypothetical protein